MTRYYPIIPGGAIVILLLASCFTALTWLDVSLPHWAARHSNLTIPIADDSTIMLTCALGVGHGQMTESKDEDGHWTYWIRVPCHPLPQQRPPQP